MKRLINLVMPLLMVLSIGTVTVFASNGQGAVQSRTDTVNINDYSTDNWMRFEYNYQFESGADTKDTLGVPTQTDIVVKNPEMENVRRNKDAAFIPPGYGVFSGEIPTNPSSPYHSNIRPDYAVNSKNSSNSLDSYYGASASSVVNIGNTGLLPSTSMTQTSGISNSNSEIIISQSSDSADYLLTQASLYEDGSIGTIGIPTLNLTVKVFEGETLDSMKHGVGHFEFTSSWDGNIGVAGHNRGSAGYFENIKNMKIGDIITFSTKYGNRTYEVFSKEKITDTDYSKLGWSNQNMITLITCVENEPSLRWCVQAIQK